MRKLSIIGIGAGNPDYITVQAIKALETLDVVFLLDKGDEKDDLAGFYRRVWSLGSAGIEIPMSVYRDGKTIETRLKSGDRNRFLKTPKLH